MGNIATTTPEYTGWPFGATLSPDDFNLMLETAVLEGMGVSAPDRWIQTKRVALTGAAIHAGTGGVIAWTNPESTAIVVLRVILDLTTVSTGACTLDVGVTEVSATTTSDTLLDGIDANAAVGVFDSMNAALDSGANAKAQRLASAKWITIDEKTGDATGLVGTLIVQYVLV